MLRLLRRGITRVLLPLVWGRSQQHAATTLKDFGDIEFDSGWQYLNALSHTTDPALRRMLFENVLEEFRHADYFYDAAHALASRRLHSASKARAQLVRKAAEMPGFLAYAHEAERSIHEQFDTYAAVCGIPAVTEAFQRICADEEDHQAEALDFLHAQVGSSRRTRWLVLRAKLQRGYEAWMRGSQHLGDLFFAGLLSAVFLCFGAWLRPRQQREHTPQPSSHERAQRSVATR